MPLILVIVFQYYNSLLSVTFSELYNITKLAKSFFFFFGIFQPPPVLCPSERTLWLMAITILRIPLGAGVVVGTQEG